MVAKMVHFTQGSVSADTLGGGSAYHIDTLMGVCPQGTRGWRHIPYVRTDTLRRGSVYFSFGGCGVKRPHVKRVEFNPVPKKIEKKNRKIEKNPKI